MKNIIKGALCSLAISSAMLMSCGGDEDPNIIFNDIDSVAKLTPKVVEQIVSNTVSLKTDDFLKLYVGGEAVNLCESGQYSNIFSSDPSVAQVDGKGLVSAKEFGQANIYVGIDNRIVKTYSVISLDNSKDYCFVTGEDGGCSFPKVYYSSFGFGSDNNATYLYRTFYLGDIYFKAYFKSEASDPAGMLNDLNAEFVAEKSNFWDDDNGCFDIKSVENVSLSKDADGVVVFHISLVSMIYGDECSVELNCRCVLPERNEISKN